MTLVVLVGSAFAQPKVAAPADPAAISAKLAGGDKAVVASAVADIDALMEAQPAVAAAQLRGAWLDTLVANGMYADAERLSVRAMAELAPESYALEQIQKLRIKAFMAQGKAGEALAAAKGLFNIASLGSTKAAVLQLAESLSAANPEDPSVVNRFRRELMAGAESTTMPATRPTSVLSQIHIDPAPFAEALKRYDTSRYTIESNPYRNRVALGNLLLLCDRADEAKTVFEEAARVASGDESNVAMENIARAIKAQTGTIGPANAWMK